MDRTIYSIVSCILLCLSQHSFSQRFSNLNTEFPMGASRVIFQDRDGFLWIGTINGLVRYDGYTARTFTHDPADTNTLAGNSVIALAQDSAGWLWIGHRSYGLDLLDPDMQQVIHLCLPDTLGKCQQEISVTAIAIQDTATMWVGSDQGLYRFTLGDSLPVVAQVYRSRPHDIHSLSSDHITRLLYDRHDRLWVGTAYGINMFEEQTGTFVNHRTENTFTAVQVLDIDEDRNGTIYVSPRFTDACLVRFDEASRKFHEIPEYLGRKLGEFRITFDLDNNLWISSRGVGVFFVDAQSDERTYFDPAKGAFHGYRNVHGVQPYTDRYGNIWIAGNALMQWPATGKTIASLNTGENPVSAIYADRDRIWYSDNEPMRFDRQSLQASPYWPAYLPTNLRAPDPDAYLVRKVYCIRPFDTDRLVMSSTRSIVMWNRNTDVYREYALDYGGPFREFVIDPDNNHLWIAGNQGSPIVLNLTTGLATYAEAARAIRNPRCVTQSANGDLWFGSGSDGAYLLMADTREIVHFTPAHQEASYRISDFHVTDIAVTPDVVLIATHLGLNIIDRATFAITQLRKGPDFPNESVMSVLVDDRGDYWMATQQGIIRYQHMDEEFTHFTKADGLINGVFMQGAAHKDSAGVLYFGGDQGIDYLDPRRMGSNSLPPDLYLNRILVNNERVDTSIAAHRLKHLTLRHHENFIEVELLALHLTAPAGNQYAYRIPDIDSHWRDLGTQRTITMANMAPGEYTLQARVANDDGVWSTDKTLLHIIIRPPFWATWWFISICALLAGLTLAAGYRFRIAQIRTQERLRTEFNKRIAELESKALRAQMNPHFLFNSINSVKSLISQGENTKATEYLTQFGQLIRQVLANSEKPMVRLQEELDALRLYLLMEQLRFQNFIYDIHVAEHVNVDFIEVPPLILQPYVENAIWHGLMHKTNGERKIYIHVDRKDDYLHMTVEDNGIGREKAKHLKMLGSARKGGMGMRLTSDRLSLLRKSYGQDAYVQVTDLQANGHATGTRVEIGIPCVE